MHQRSVSKDRFSFSMFLLSALVICSSASLSHAVVVGEDQRMALNTKDYPFMTFGRITSKHPQGKTCTGTLVGNRVVLTAAHCVPPSKGPYQFQPSLNNPTGNSISPINVTKVISGLPNINPDVADESWADDWAFLVLDDPFGLRMGYITVATSLGAMTPDVALSKVVSYPYNRTSFGKIPMYQDGCTVFSAASFPLNWGRNVTDCDIEVVASGASVFQYNRFISGLPPAIVGVISTGADDQRNGCTFSVGGSAPCHNLVVPSERFYLKWLEVVAGNP